MTTGFLSEIGTKLRESAVGQAGGSCYSRAALSSNDSKTLYLQSYCWKGYLFIRAWPRPTDRDPCFHCRNRFRNSTEDGIRPLFRWRHSRRRLHLCIERERGLHTQDASCTADLVNVAYESLRRHRRRHLGAFSVSLSDFLVAVDPTLIPSSSTVN